MKTKGTLFFIIFLICSYSINSQEEKRLALVIGNANYEKGELKNPVNDARLIASTLDSLDFDVILKENIESQIDFKRAILEFGKKRPKYDIAFVYYAGHGVQVSDENYLLPTKVEFSSEDEVEMFGVSIQDIMRYLKAQTDQVNILILDACRDNPFESNWNKTRSLKGRGLAKIPAPTGSLIAFSTDSGQTAPDGDGENSIYTISLAKNMLLENTSIDQVFRNVRTEVLTKTEGFQRPVEATQLTGQTFYLKKPSIEILSKKINDNLMSLNFEDAELLIDKMVYEYPEKALGYAKKGHLNFLRNQFYESYINYLKAFELNPNLHELYSLIIWNINQEGGSTHCGLFGILQEWKAFTKQKNDSINIDINDILNIYKKWANLQNEDPFILYTLGFLDFWFSEPYDITNKSYLKAEEFVGNFKKYEEKNNIIKKDNNIKHSEWFYLGLADLQMNYNMTDKAEYYLKIVENISLKNKGSIAYPYILSRLGDVYKKRKKYQLAIDYYEKSRKIIGGINYYSTADLANSYYQVGDVKKTKELFIEMINNNKKNASFYYRQSLFYYSIEEYLNSIESISKANALADYQNFSDLIKILVKSKIKPDSDICDLINEYGFSDNLTSNFFSKKGFYDYEIPYNDWMKILKLCR